jgi:hypothetical protein
MDAKWLVIAKRAQVAPGVVSAVAWSLFDYASQANPRGSVTGFDVETYATFSGFAETDIEAVIEAMKVKGVIGEDGRLANWDKRQPKREDESTPRVREFRKREAEKDAMKLTVTQCNDREDKDTDTDTDTEIESPATPAATAATAETPVSLSGWNDKLRDSKNKQADLLLMFKTLFPDAVDTPDFGYVAKTARAVGGAGRLAELMWQAAARPPSGDVMAYCLRMSKNEKKVPRGDRSFAASDQSYEGLKAKYVPVGWEDIIKY